MKTSLRVDENKLFITNSEMHVVLDVLNNEENLPFLVEDIPDDIFSIIEKITAVEFPEGLTLYCTKYKMGNFPAWVDLSHEIGSSKISVEISFGIYYEQWAHPFTVTEFFDLFVIEVSRDGYFGRIDNKEPGVTYAFIQGETTNSEVILDAIERTIRHSLNSYESAEIKLNKKSENEFLIKLFNFPAEYKFICTQYLIWFGELLSQLGIKANIHTEQNGSNTKFMISPENSPEIVHEIEKLFHIYLALPYAEFLPKVQSSTYEKAIVANLQAQVSNFQSQVTLKDSIIELKNETINSLKMTLEQKS